MNDEGKKFEIKKSMETFMNKNMFKTVMENENLSVVEYYKKYLNFIPKDVIEAIEEMDKEYNLN